MKHLVITLAALFAAASAMAQGTVNFATRVGTAVSAPVTYKSDGALVGGTGAKGIQAQIWAAAPGGTLAPVGAIAPFRSDAGIGFITAGGTVEIPGVAAGGSADVKLVAWSVGKAYGDVGMGDWMGESSVITVATGGGTLPPGNLIGLQGFQVDQIVPEPSMAALGLLGAGLLLIRRKK